MKLIRKSLAVGLAVAAATVVACSTGPHQTAPGTASNTNPSPAINAPGSTDSTGAIGMQLTLPGGEHISKINYILTNGTNTLSGSYNVTSTATLSFVIGSVPAGSGYSLSISGTSDDGNYTCSYPAPGDPLTSNITVVNRTTTVVNVNLQCLNNQGQDAGSVLVNAVESNCPVWNTIVANPYNILIDGGQNVNNSGSAGATAFFGGASPTAVINDGQQLVLVGSATGPNPGALAFTWTTTGGTISNATGTLDPNSTDAGTTNQTVFTCPPAPAVTTTYTVTLTLSDGPVPDGGACDPKFTTGTVQVTCSNPLPCGGGPFATVQTYASGLCTGNGNVSVNDSHGFPWVPGPADVNVPTDFCCAGACGDGTVAGSPATLSTTFPSGTGGCGTNNTVNNGAGCCVPLLPCTTAGQLNCVQCQGNDKAPNANMTCTPTEAAIVQKDIASGKSFAPGPGPTGSCYQCLYAGGCIDDTHFGDVGHECEDTLAVGTAAQCEATLACIFTSKCAASAVSVCYCGTAGLSTTCQGNPAAGPINGACDSQIAAGDGFAVTDGTDNTAHLTDITRAGGKADQIFQCALTNGCTACQN